MLRFAPRSALAPFCSLGCLLLAALVALCLTSCDRKGNTSDANTVVLYSSMDEGVIRPIIDLYEKRRGVKVLLVGDTEATKTTGLVQRLIAERGKPTADVWWSSEALGTAKLSNLGILAPYASKINDKDFDKGWPQNLRGIDGDWYGYAARPRVFVYHSTRVAAGDVPRTLVDLTRERFRGKVGMAAPEFGTTRGHMAALRSLVGEEHVEAWLAVLRANGLRIYDGNATVVRAINLGEIDVGLTDHDDVLAGQQNGWPVAAAYEAEGLTPTDEDKARFGPLAAGTGALMTPCTVGLVKGARHLQGACDLIDFLLSSEVERLLAKSGSGNVPIRAAVAAEFPQYRVPQPTFVDWESVIDR